MDNQSIISLKIPKTKMISIFASSFFFFIIAFLLWNQQGIDVSTVLMHNFVYENVTLLQFMKAISRFGMGFISLFYCLVLFLSFRKDELELNKPLFLYIIFAFAFGSIAGDLMKELFSRARPAVLLAEFGVTIYYNGVK